MEWGQVLVPAAIGAAIPVLLALLAAARWSGRIDQNVQLIREQTTASGRDIHELRALIGIVNEKLRDVEVGLRERMTRVESVAETWEEPTVVDLVNQLRRSIEEARLLGMEFQERSLREEDIGEARSRREEDTGA